MSRAALADALSLRSAEILCGLVAILIGARIAGARSEAREVLVHEARVRAVLSDLHRAEAARVAAGGDFEPLGGLLSHASVTASLREIDAVEERRSGERTIEVARIGPYLLAVYVTTGDGERHWSQRDAERAQVPRTGYGAFAWPAELGKPCSWAYAVDRHGLLLGTWNPEGRLEGFREPFPPEEHPLRSYLLARKEGEDGVWFLFDDLGEILPRQP